MVILFLKGRHGTVRDNLGLRCPFRYGDICVNGFMGGYNTWFTFSIISERLFFGTNVYYRVERVRQVYGSI